MGIIAWIFLGLLSALLAQRLLPGRRASRLTLTSLAGISGALLGGWAAVTLLQAQALSAFFSLPAWLTALAGAAVFLLASRTLTGRPGEPGRNREAVPVPVPVRSREAPKSRG
jgi:uncharacterized membrane protein YeaQ/YmgE (transglycosylase-associated protein family)